MAIVPTSPEVATAYLGLSGDTKPTIATPGSTFYETDTKNSFITDGVGNWYAMPTPGGGGGGDATAANQVTANTEIGGLTETAPATDTASSGLNGRLQRIAQRLSSLIALIPTALGAGGGLKVDGSGTALPVSAATLPLPTGAATSALQGPATIADGANVAQGTTTDAAASSTVAETATARTGIGLWKGIKNILILINAGITSLLTGIVLAAGTNAIGKLAANAGVNIGVVGGTTIEVSDEFARPADTTAYAAGDSIAAATTDSGTTPLRSIVVGAANGATGYLTKFRLDTDQAACVAVLEVHFYTVAAPPSVVTGDNVPFTLLYPNRAKRIGSLVFPALATTTPAGSSTMAKTQDMTTRMAFQCDPADNKIYYRILTQTVFTPNNGQSFFLALTSERNAG